jgi:hypothetical protein
VIAGLRPDYRCADKVRRRTRRRSRLLTSARTATRTFDLQLAIAALRVPAPALCRDWYESEPTGSVWRQQGAFLWLSPSSGRGPFRCGSIVHRWPKNRRAQGAGLKREIIRKCYSGACSQNAPLVFRLTNTWRHGLGGALTPQPVTQESSRYLGRSPTSPRAQR